MLLKARATQFRLAGRGDQPTELFDSMNKDPVLTLAGGKNRTFILRIFKGNEVVTTVRGVLDSWIGFCAMRNVSSSRVPSLS